MHAGRTFLLAALAVMLAMSLPAQEATGMMVFNVRDYGASGKRSDGAREGIQKAIDACAMLGGGMVYLPPGEYTSGTLHLRSHVRLHLEAGAVLFSSKNRADFDKEALLLGEDLENISIEGRGALDGLAAYEWRENDVDDPIIRENEQLQKTAGRSLLRPFAKKDAFGKLLLLIRCRDVQVSGLAFVHAPDWTIHAYSCERMTITGISIQTSLTEGIGANGLNPDGCRDLRISDCSIETGGDALAFNSLNTYGPARSCENVTVTSCHLSSAASAIKFAEGNAGGIRKVTISNCVISGANRAIALMVFDGGSVSDVLISGLTIECLRHEWFFWGDGEPLCFSIRRRSEVGRQPARMDDAPAGSIRNVIIRDIIAHGKGSSLLSGHPLSWLENITLENIHLFVGDDAERPVQKAEHALKCRWVRNLKLHGLEVTWDNLRLPRWKSALDLEDAEGVEIVGFSGRPARPGGNEAAIAANRVSNVVWRQCRAQPGTDVFLRLDNLGKGGAFLIDSDLRAAEIIFQLGKSVSPSLFHSANNLLR